MIYKYWPEQHVFFDDRYDMYPIAMTDAYNKVLSLKPGWEHVLDQYRIDIVVWPKDGAFVQALEHLPGWTEIRHDKVCDRVRTRFARCASRLSRWRRADPELAYGNAKRPPVDPAAVALACDSTLSRTAGRSISRRRCRSRPG